MVDTLTSGDFFSGRAFKQAQEKAQDPDKKSRESCMAKGGKWDPSTKTCIMPQKQTETETAKTQEPSNANQVFRDESGRASGVTINGKTYLGLSPQEVEGLLASEQAKQGGPATQQFEQGITTQQQAQQQANLLQTPGMELTPDGRQVVQDGGVVSNVATGGAALAGGIVGAKSGAAVGTLIAPGIGTIIGGIVGGIGGAIGGAYVKQRVQKTQSIKQANKVFTQAKTNKGEILNMINAGLVTEGQARSLWQEEKQNIAASQAYLKRQTQSDLNNFLGNPGDDLVAIESYLALDALYDLEFEKALLQPNPAMIRRMENSEE